MITVYGSSDDLIEVDGAVGASPEEYYSHGVSKLAWRADFIEPSDDLVADRLRVYAIYDGCWHFSVGQTDEQFKLPEWPIRITQAPKLDGNPGYSTLLTIEAPEGTRIRNIWPAPADGES